MFSTFSCKRHGRVECEFAKGPFCELVDGAPCKHNLAVAVDLAAAIKQPEAAPLPP